VNFTHTNLYLANKYVLAIVECKLINVAAKTTNPDIANAPKMKFRISCMRNLGKESRCWHGRWNYLFDHDTGFDRLKMK